MAEEGKLGSIVFSRPPLWPRPGEGVKYKYATREVSRRVKKKRKKGM